MISRALSYALKQFLMFWLITYFLMISASCGKMTAAPARNVASQTIYRVSCTGHS